MWRMSLTSDLNTLGAHLQVDLVSWGVAAIGIALVASAILWVMRLIGTR